MYQRIATQIKKSFSEISIRHKVESIMILQSTIVLVLVSLTVFANFTFIKHKEAREDLTALADIVAQNAGAAIVFRDSKAAQEILDGLKEKKRILSAYILDGSNTIVANYHSKSSESSNNVADILKDMSPSRFDLFWVNDNKIIKNIDFDGK